MGRIQKLSHPIELVKDFKNLVGKKKKGAQKNHHTWDSAHSLCKTRSVTLDTDAHPLGFDSLACDMGEQHLPVELSGF